MPPIEPGLIDHQVDAQLGYRTRTLLCVPLRGGSGELFGAFELINKLAGNFTDEDQAALIDLAARRPWPWKTPRTAKTCSPPIAKSPTRRPSGSNLIGRSPAIEALRSIIRRVADTDLAVLILGENGTGKEVVAQSIHYGSRRARPAVHGRELRGHSRELGRERTVRP